MCERPWVSLGFKWLLLSSLLPKHYHFFLLIPPDVSPAEKLLWISLFSVTTMIFQKLSILEKKRYLCSLQFWSDDSTVSLALGRSLWWLASQ